MTPSPQAPQEQEHPLDAAAANLGVGGATPPEQGAAASTTADMEQRQQVQHQRVQARQLEKVLWLVFTGRGKGKTTAGLSLVLRTLGHGEQLRWHALEEGFTWNTQDRERDQGMVNHHTWRQACVYLLDATIKLVLLDEINAALKLGYISLETVLAGLEERTAPHSCGPPGGPRLTW